MLETKSLTVSPDEEQGTINLMQDFGWTLKSSQEINNTDSHLERRGDEIYNVTTKQNYVKLVFDRDTKMESYDRVRNLEGEYHRIMNSEPTAEYVSISWLIAIIGLVLYVVPGVAYLAWKFTKKKQCADAYNAAYAAWRAEAEKAVGYRKEARSLL